MPPSAANFTAEDYRAHFAANKHVKEIQGHTSKVHALAWSCDGRHLSSGSFDKTVAIYSVDRSDRISRHTVFKGHTDSVDSVSWHRKHPDILVSAGLDKSVRFWDLRSSRCVANIPTKGDNISASWSPNGKFVAVGDKDDRITIIDCNTRSISSENHYKFEVNEFAWNKECDLFYLTTGTGEIHVLSFPDLETQLVLKAHCGTCICMSMDPSFEHFAVGSADSTTSIWNATELCPLRTVSRLEFPVRSVSFSHDGSLLASASEDLLIDIAYVDSGEQVTSVPIISPAFAVAFHPTKPLLAFACDDKDPNDRDREAGTVKIWGLS